MRLRCARYISMKNFRFLPSKLAIATGERKNKSVTFHAGFHASSERMWEFTVWRVRAWIYTEFRFNSQWYQFIFHFSFFAFLLLFLPHHHHQSEVDSDALSLSDWPLRGRFAPPCHHPPENGGRWHNIIWWMNELHSQSFRMSVTPFGLMWLLSDKCESLRMSVNPFGWT